MEKEDGGDEQKTEKNGGVFSGIPGPRRACSTVDWWIFCVNNKKGDQGSEGAVAPP
jgi:hypothetical protein